MFCREWVPDMQKRLISCGPHFRGGGGNSQNTYHYPCMTCSGSRAFCIAGGYISENSTKFNLLALVPCSNCPDFLGRELERLGCIGWNQR